MADQRKDIVHRFYDGVVNEGNLDRLPDVVTDDIVDHEAPPGMPGGIEGVKAFVEMFRTGFPDLHVTVESVIQEDDLVAARVRYTGTHEGEFMGIPPSHNKIDIDVIDMVRMEGDKCAEHWGVTDNLGLMQQIGAVPATA
jgi:predicted ester cyclase